MKTWIHRDKAGDVLAVVATDDSGAGTLSLSFAEAAAASEIDCTGCDDPRDVASLERFLSARGIVLKGDLSDPSGTS